MTSGAIIFNLSNWLVCMTVTTSRSLICSIIEKHSVELRWLNLRRWICKVIRTSWFFYIRRLIWDNILFFGWAIKHWLSFLIRLWGTNHWFRNYCWWIWASWVCKRRLDFCWWLRRSMLYNFIECFIIRICILILVKFVLHHYSFINSDIIFWLVIDNV